TSFSIDKADFIEKLLSEAKSLKCSDIHFEVYEESSRIRFRIDGQLIERYKVDRENYLELVNKIKIKAKLNITEKRLPQDGRITTGSFDIRVSILPTLFGEKIVMRLLGQDASNIDLNTLGLQEAELFHYLEAVKKPNGIILISGPTGSGKTTTLYATLRLLNDSKRNIVTVEDPIEYTLRGINQVQLKEDIGLTFASALKSFLRQDPDVIMLGEIRDSETALMAIRASLTGHLVLSTIHTNSAVGTISRLIDMGVPSYLISETLNLSVAQRLVRKLCPNCKTEAVFQAGDFPLNYKFPYQISTYSKPSGCNKCFHTGYKGRTAIYEVLTIDHIAAQAIKNNTLSQLSESDENYKSLSDKAYDILAKGETSLEEIYSILINI
ncbi:MAG TPA: GspE/PulE family protein, partial [Flavobacterium sp.]|nr:GspE/PulE family protein [Flavobacterium sp.]